LAHGARSHRWAGEVGAVIHHVSFNARDPEQVARGLAQLLGARAVRAPQPPFPLGSWFIAYGDEQGTLIEVLPWSRTLDPEVSNGLGHDPDMRVHTGTHLAVQGIARLHGWRTLPASAGFFSFTKVWIEGTFLVEIMTAEQAKEYVATFSRSGIGALDGKLRWIESALTQSQ
jgi:catechol 2,3-dioxygenase-like lactoylglutathione lyase family enzyme